MDSLQHITSLITDIPSWLILLDTQNEQIGRRQTELARLSGSSLDQSFAHRDTSGPGPKNRGSTESLRPRANGKLMEEDEEAIVSGEDDDPRGTAGLKIEKTISASNPLRSTPSPNIKQVSTPRSPRLLQKKSNSIKETQPNPLKTQTHSSPTGHPPPPPPPPPHLSNRRKSKTSSIHSMHSSNSQTSTHVGRLTRANRTRSMIIVYYDSAVQEAFELLVRYISAARNAMRKGKMAERMERMKMLAELEDSSDSSEEEQDENLALEGNQKLDQGIKAPNKYSSPATYPNANNLAGLGNAKASTYIGDNKLNSTGSLGKIEVENSDGNEDEIEFLNNAKLQFKGTRMMTHGAPTTGGSGGRLSNINASSSPYRRAGAILGADSPVNSRPVVNQTNSSPVLATGLGIGNTKHSDETSVYDKLDKSLEWCQSTCESAAHRFLRDGECYSEIAGVKKRLEELVVRVKEEIAKVEENKEDNRAKKGSRTKVRMIGGVFGNMMPGEIGLGQVRAREMRSPLMRKSTTPVRTFSSPTPLESPVDSTGMAKPAPTGTAGTNEGLDGKIEALEDVDEGLSDMDIELEPPKLMFRSARAGGMVRR